jgi:hypothetical protein
MLLGHFGAGSAASFVLELALFTGGIAVYLVDRKRTARVLQEAVQ